MSGKYRFLTLSAIIAMTLASIQGVCAFELFPRPDGEPHTVRRGDTLFSLSEKYYGNGDLWPFLWNQNPQIRIKDTKTPPEKQELQRGVRMDLYDVKSQYLVSSQTQLPGTGIPFELRFLTEKTPYKGIPYDKKYFSYKLSLRPTQVWGYIACAPDNYKTYYLERDLVYVQFRPSKKQAILVGDRFGIYRERGPLNHPVDHDRQIGFQSEIVGEIEITSTGNDLATGIILESYVEIVKGDKLCLFTPRDREIIPSKTHRLLTGTILSAATRDAFMGATYGLENDIIFVDRGECDGMREGMLLNIYRPGHPSADPNFHRRLGLPDKYIGEGMVLKSFDKNCTVIITLSKEEILPGDIIKTVSD
jgi:hypothetical protein